MVHSFFTARTLFRQLLAVRNIRSTRLKLYILKRFERHIDAGMLPHL